MIDHDRTFSHVWAAAGTLLLLLAVPAAATVYDYSDEMETHGLLPCVTSEEIQDTFVASWVANHIPAACQKLIVTTAPYGGDFAQPFLLISNTVLLSATSTGQIAYYKGYDAGAIEMMGPALGRTALDVHNAGVAAKRPEEDPMAGGTLLQSAFPLDPVTTNGAVRSRHIILYVDAPSPRRGRDVDQLFALSRMFAGQLNTSIEVVGGPSDRLGGINVEATAKKLRNAIKAMGQDIASSPDPSKEQFIMYICGHGGYEVVKLTDTNVPASESIVVENFKAFDSSAIDPSSMIDSLENVTCFSTIIQVPASNTVNAADLPIYPPDSFYLYAADNSNAFEYAFDTIDYVEVPREFGDDIIGNEPGEGIEIRFEIDEFMFLNSLDRHLQVSFHNDSGQAVHVHSIRQATGKVGKGFPPTIINFTPIQDKIEIQYEVMPATRVKGQSRTSLSSGTWEDMGGSSYRDGGVYTATLQVSQARMFLRLIETESP